MADRNWRFALRAIALSTLFLVMPGSARAALITVDTLASGSVSGHCTLHDAVASANNHATASPSDCAAGTGNDTIEFSVTGTITVNVQLTITDSVLEIEGPSTAPGVIISGASVEVFDAENTTFILDDLTVANGDASYGGGAIYADCDDLQINNCLFTNNTGAYYGGAIFTDGPTVEITNTTFAFNSADYAGGIYNDGSIIYLTNTTFDGNNGIGGALNSSSPTLMKACLFKLGSSGANCSGFPATENIDAGFNISDDSSCNFTQSTSYVEAPGLDGSGLENIGGPTQTVALVSGSPAIGLDTDCTDQFGHPVLSDQRLFFRPNSPIFCDSGAYEFDGLPNAAFGLVPHTERLQVARSTSPDSDDINLALTFFENGAPTCGPQQDALNSGFGVEVFPGTCADFIAGTEVLDAMMTFATQTVNHHSYGTFAQSSPYPVSSKLVVVKPSSGDFCGEWNLTLESSGLDTSSLGAGPIALVLLQPDLAATCFDITNAIIGSQIPKPLIPIVRRGVRR